VSEQFRQMPLFTIEQETVIGDGTIFVIEWVTWYNGESEFLFIYAYTGG